MRRAIARNSQVQSQSIDIFGIPATVRALLDMRVDDYGDACRLGKQAAGEFAKCLGAQRHLSGTGRLLSIARHIDANGCSHGIAAGFFAEIDGLILRASNSVCLPIQRQTAADEAREDLVRHSFVGHQPARRPNRRLQSPRQGVV